MLVFQNIEMDLFNLFYKEVGAKKKVLHPPKFPISCTITHIKDLIRIISDLTRIYANEGYSAKFKYCFEYMVHNVKLNIKISPHTPMVYNIKNEISDKLNQKQQESLNIVFNLCAFYWLYGSKKKKIYYNKSFYDSYESSFLELQERDELKYLGDLPQMVTSSVTFYTTFSKYIPIFLTTYYNNFSLEALLSDKYHKLYDFRNVTNHYGILAIKQFILMLIEEVKPEYPEHFNLIIKDLVFRRLPKHLSDDLNTVLMLFRSQELSKHFTNKDISFIFSKENRGKYLDILPPKSSLLAKTLDGLCTKPSGIGILEQDIINCYDNDARKTKNPNEKWIKIPKKTMNELEMLYKIELSDCKKTDFDDNLYLLYDIVEEIIKDYKNPIEDLFYLLLCINAPEIEKIVAIKTIFDTNRPKDTRKLINHIIYDKIDIPCLKLDEIIAEGLPIPFNYVPKSNYERNLIYKIFNHQRKNSCFKECDPYDFYKHYNQFLNIYSDYRGEEKEIIQSTPIDLENDKLFKDRPRPSSLRK